MNTAFASASILLYTATIGYGEIDNISNEYEQFSKIAITSLQACKDKETTLSRSMQIALLLNVVFLNKPFQSFLESDQGKLYHAILRAEIERMNGYRWFGFPAMQGAMPSDEFLSTTAIDPNMALFPREDIITQAGRLQNNNPQADIPRLILGLADFY